MYIMSKRKHSYHVICDCFYVSRSGKHLPISRIGDIELSFNGIIESDVSKNVTALVLEYRICSSRELHSSMHPYLRNRIYFRLTLFPLGRKSSRSSYVNEFHYRFIPE